MADVADEVNDLVDSALAGSTALNRLERSADSVSDELDSISRSAQAAVANVTAAAGAIELLDSAVSDTDLSGLDLSDVTLDFDTDDLAQSIAVLQQTSGEADTAAAALRQLAATDIDTDATVGVATDSDGQPPSFDTDTITQRVTVAVDRTDLERTLSTIDTREIELNPVLGSLQSQLRDATDDELVTITAETDELTAALSATEALREQTDELDSAIARIDSGRASVSVSADVARAIASIESVHAKLDQLDGSEATVSVDTSQFVTDFEHPDISGTERIAIDPFLVDTPPEVEPELDTDTLANQVIEAQSVLGAIPERTSVSIDSDVDLSAVDRARRTLASLSDRHVSITADDPAIEYGVDTGAIERTATLIDALPEDARRTLQTDIDVDASPLEHARLTVDALASQSTDIPIDAEADLSDVQATQAALTALPQRVSTVVDTQVTADTDFDTDTSPIAAATRSIRSIPDITRSVTTTSEFDIDTEAIERTATLLENIPADVETEFFADVDADASAIERLRALLNSLAAREITIPVNAEADLSDVRAAQDLLNSLPDRTTKRIDFRTDTDSIAQITQRLRDIPDISRSVGAASEFDIETAPLERADSLLRSLTADQRARISVIADTGGARSDIEQTRTVLETLLSDDFTIDIDTDLDRDIDVPTPDPGDIDRSVSLATDGGSIRQFANAASEIGTTATAAAEGLDPLADRQLDVAQKAAMATDRFERLGSTTDDVRSRFARLRSALDLSDIPVPDIAERIDLPTFGGDPDPLQAQQDAVADLADQLYALPDFDLGDTSNTTALARQLEASADDLGDEALQAAADLRSLDAGISDLVGSSVASSASAEDLARDIDDIGDEAIESAAEVETLEASVGSLDDATTRLNLGPLSGRLSSLLPLLAPVAAGLAGVAGAAGGVATGFGAIGGAGALAVFGGLQSRAEDLAASSSEIEDAGEGMEEIWTQFGKAAKNALEPLQTDAMEGFSMGLLSGVVEILRDGATFAADFFDELDPVLDSLGSQFWSTEPEFFAELSRAASDTLPYLEDFVSYLITAGPDAIRFFRTEGLELVDDLGSLSTQAISTAASLVDIGNALGAVVLPALTATLWVAETAMNVFGALPGPLQEAAIAGGIAAAAFTVLSGSAVAATLATEGLTAALAVLTAPISGTALAIGALIGAVVGIVSYFGWWDDIASGLAGTFNFLVDVLEFLINGVIAGAGAVADFAMSFGIVADAVGVLGDLLTWLGGIVDWVFDKLGDMVSFAKDVFDAVAGIFGDANAAAEEAGGVDLDQYKVGQDGSGDGSEGEGGGGGPGSPPSAPSQSQPNPDNPFSGQQSAGFDATTPGSDGTITGDAVASLPSAGTSTPSSSSTAGTTATTGSTGQQPATPLSSGGGGKTVHNTWDIDIDNSGNPNQNINEMQVKRWFSEWERQTGEQNGPAG